MSGIVKGQRVLGPHLGAARELRGRQTQAEQHLWQFVRAGRLGGHHFRRQQPIGPYIVDFFCAASRLAVEIDGPIHESQVEYDQERDAYLTALDLRVLRFSNEAVLSDTQCVLKAISTALEIVPTLSLQGEGRRPQAAGRGQ